MAQGLSLPRTQAAAACTFVAYLVGALALLGPFHLAPATPSVVGSLSVATLLALLANALCMARWAWLVGRRWYVWAAAAVLVPPLGALVGFAVLPRADRRSCIGLTQS